MLYKHGLVPTLHRREINFSANSQHQKSSTAASTANCQLSARAVGSADWGCRQLRSLAACRGTSSACNQYPLCPSLTETGRRLCMSPCVRRRGTATVHSAAAQGSSAAQPSSNNQNSYPQDACVNPPAVSTSDAQQPVAASTSNGTNNSSTGLNGDKSTHGVDNHVGTGSGGTTITTTSRSSNSQGDLTSQQQQHQQQQQQQQQQRQQSSQEASTSHPVSANKARTTGISLSPKLVVAVILALSFGVANRVLYKMALVPMQNYVFFLAQLQNVGYLITYFTALAVRYKGGLVTDAMLRIDKRPLIAIGACEAIAQLLFMIGASHLPGHLLPVINQSYLVWNLAFAAIFLQARYTRSQLGGALLVMLGVVVAAVPPQQLLALLPATWAAAGSAVAGAASGPQVQPVYVGVCLLCFAFPALAAIIKDMTFRNERSRLGQPLDIFIVNSFSSLFQSLFVLLLLPITTALHGMSLAELPQYLAEGTQCFMGSTPACSPGGNCSGAPLLPLAYVAANLAFNISMLRLLRSVGTVTTTIVGSTLVPLTIAAFCLPLPFLTPTTMGANFLLGFTLLMSGLVLYNYHPVVKPLMQTLLASESMDLPSP